MNYPAYNKIASSGDEGNNKILLTPGVDPNEHIEAMGPAGDCVNVLDRTKLIVNYIPQFATETDLASIFTPIGEVESIKIIRDNKTGYSYGFGFVKYSNVDDAARAIREINGMNFKNKRLKVSYSRPASAVMKDTNLYISNLPREINEHEVRELFAPYGEIVQVTVLRDKITDLPRGVAFVRYARSDSAQSAITQLHGKQLENTLQPLSVRVAEDHGRQKAQYLDRMQMRMLPTNGYCGSGGGGGGGGIGGGVYRGMPPSNHRTNTGPGYYRPDHHHHQYFH